MYMVPRPAVGWELGPSPSPCSWFRPSLLAPGSPFSSEQDRTTHPLFPSFLCPLIPHCSSPRGPGLGRAWRGPELRLKSGPLIASSQDGGQNDEQQVPSSLLPAPIPEAAVEAGGVGPEGWGTEPGGRVAIGKAPWRSWCRREGRKERLGSETGGKETLRGQEQRRVRVSGGTWGWLAGGAQSLACAEAGQWGK